MAWEPDYITSAEFKHYTSIEALDTVDDAEIGFAITAASRAVDKCCSERFNGMGAKRQFGQTAAPEVRYYTPRWDNDLIRWVIEVDDFDDITSLVVQVSTGNNEVYNGTITDYVLRPRNALADKRVYTQIAIATASSIQPVFFRDSAKITNKWGWTTTPTTVKTGTFTQAHRFAKRRQSPMGVTGSPQKGTEAKLLEEVDPDIALMLTDYVKLGWTQ